MTTRKESSLEAVGDFPIVAVKEIRDYAIFVLDPGGRILTWNEGAQAIKGYAADEIVGQNFSRFFPAEDRERGKPNGLLDRAARDGRVTDQGWRVRKDGELFWADVVLTAIHDEDGALRGFIKITRDLTGRRRTEMMLRQSEERLRLIVESLHDYAIFMLDPDGRIVSSNIGAKHGGYAAEDVLQKHFSVLYSEEDRRRGHPACELERAAADGRYTEESWLVRKDGSLFWAEVVITALYDSEHRSIGFVQVTRDLTERRRAEEMLRQSEERLRLLIESVTDYAIFMLEPTGKVVTWNAGAQRIKGYSAAEVIGKHFSMFYTEEDRLRRHPDEALQRAARHGRDDEEVWLTRKDGSRFWASVVITAVHDPIMGKLRGFSKVTRDLTARRQAEHERIQRAKAEEALRLRDEFLSIAAHELKTPLTSLQLQVSGIRRALEKGPSGTRDEKLDGRMKIVSAELDRFERLINDLLDVSRARAGHFDLTPEQIELGSLVSEVVRRFGDAAGEAHSDLSTVVREPVVGHWDRLRLEHVITNLIANAIKFGAGAPIEVRVGRPSAELASVEVCDHGIGIEASRHSEIFERFVRAVSKEHYGGFGLGLWIVHAIVDMMGGSVSVRSAPGAGSTFTVLLPLDAQAMRAPPEAPAGARGRAD